MSIQHLCACFTTIYCDYLFALYAVLYAWNCAIRANHAVSNSFTVRRRTHHDVQSSVQMLHVDDLAQMHLHYSDHYCGTRLSPSFPRGIIASNRMRLVRS